MKLPKIEHPLFELKIPSTGKTAKYRPFTVKEEKILLIAQETKDIDQAILSMKQVVNNCLVDTNIDKLAMFDLEYILINLRSKSVDNGITFSIKDDETNEKIELTLDLNNMSVVIPEDHSTKIKIDDTYTLIMRYPTINEFKMLVSGDPENSSATSFNIMMKCIDKLATSDEVFEFSNFSQEEIDEFVDSLSPITVVQIKKFFESMPKIRHELKYTNKEGKEKTFVIEGIQSFFI